MTDFELLSFLFLKLVTINFPELNRIQIHVVEKSYGSPDPDLQPFHLALRLTSFEPLCAVLSQRRSHVSLVFMSPIFYTWRWRPQPRESASSRVSSWDDRRGWRPHPPGFLSKPGTTFVRQGEQSFLYVEQHTGFLYGKIPSSPVPSPVPIGPISLLG